MHWPLQKLNPDGHWQLPATQALFESQAEAQLPQFRLLICRSTHEPWQLVVPVPQLEEHWPIEQTASSAHRFPQAPQFARSATLFTQTEPQITSSAPHSTPASAIGAGRTTHAPNSTTTGHTDRNMESPEPAWAEPSLLSGQCQSRAGARGHAAAGAAKRCCVPYPTAQQACVVVTTTASQPNFNKTPCSRCQGVQRCRNSELRRNCCNNARQGCQSCPPGA